MHRDLGDELIDGLVDGASKFPTSQSAMVLIYLHGEATRVAPTQTAFASRQPQWDVSILAQWTDRAVSTRPITWTRELWSEVEPLTAGRAYVNHLVGDDRPERVRASYGQNYERLAALKATYDPTNLFRLNPNIPPRASSASRRSNEHQNSR